MKAVIGLGNPGKKYARTRHNMGFMLMDLLAERHDLSFKAGRGEYVLARDVNTDTILIKPLTYMNLSGLAVRHVLDYYHISLEDTLVVYDDLDVDFGRFKFKPQGSGGSHNGMKSIIFQLKRDDFPRLKMGIHTPGRRENTQSVDYVLSPFSKDENAELKNVLDTAADAVEHFMNDGLDDTMNRYNRRQNEKE